MVGVSDWSVTGVASRRGGRFLTPLRRLTLTRAHVDLSALTKGLALARACPPTHPSRL